MSLALDTHVVLWRFAGDWTVPHAARQAVGKLVVPPGLHEHVLASGLHVLGLAPDHGLGVTELPMHHRDPFDRLLISQARSEGLAIVTADRRFAEYDVRVIDAAGWGDRALRRPADDRRRRRRRPRRSRHLAHGPRANWRTGPRALRSPGRVEWCGGCAGRRHPPRLRRPASP